MKIILILSVVAAALAVEQTTYKMPQEITDKMKKHAAPCADENNLDHSVILKLPAGTVPNTEAGKKFLYCFTKAMGFLTEDGHMKVDKLGELLKGHPLQEQFVEALNQCNQVTKESVLDTVFAMYQCFAERPPIRIVF